MSGTRRSVAARVSRSTLLVRTARRSDCAPAERFLVKHTRQRCYAVGRQCFNEQHSDSVKRSPRPPDVSLAESLASLARVCASAASFGPAVEALEALALGRAVQLPDVESDARELASLRNALGDALARSGRLQTPRSCFAPRGARLATHRRRTARAW